MVVALRMDVVKSTTDWKPLGKKAKGKTKENYEENKLDDACKKQTSLA